MYMGLSIQIISIVDQTLQRSFKVNFHSRQGFGLVGCLISWLDCPHLSVPLSDIAPVF